MPEQPEPLTEGDLIAGRFRIEGVLGEGGMGSVYEAMQLNLGRPVALKVLLPEYGVREDARLRFEREARVAATLHHTNAVTIIDFGEDQGRLFLAMERLSGATLRETLNNVGPCKLGTERAIEIVSQICSVLVAAHQLALVHRDLKPENIFLERSDDGGIRVVVVDFGLAFITNRQDVGRMTRDGILSGTPEYISPEQVRSKQVGPPVDIYSLGCVFYEMMAGDVPFRGENAFEVISHHVYSKPQLPRHACPELCAPPGVEELVMSMLAKEAESRPSAQEVLEALEDYRGDKTSTDRYRTEGRRLGRESRMIPRPSSPIDVPTLNDADALTKDQTEVIVVGVLDEGLRSALVVNAIAPKEIESLSGDPGNAAAIYAPDAPLEVLRELRSLRIPLLTDAEPSDMNRVSELLSLGINDVVPIPVRGEELARKVWRAIRKSKRIEHKERG